MSLVRAPWFLIPAASTTFAVVVTVFVNIRNHQVLRHRIQFSASREAESFISAVADLANNCDKSTSPSVGDTPTLVIDLNTTHQRIVVSEGRLLRINCNLLSLFDRYAVACQCSTLPDAVKVDMFNCLSAVVEAHLNAYVSTSAMFDNVADASRALAVSEMLFGRRYHVARFLSASLSSSGLLLRTPPWQLLAKAVRKNNDDRSMWHTISVFVRLINSTCTCTEKVIFTLLAVVSITEISRLILFASPATGPSALFYTAKVLEATTTEAGYPCKWRTFVWQVLSSSPGRMLGSATLSGVASHLFSSAKEAASDAVLRRFDVTLKADTVLALTRFDYIGDPYWPIPGRVHNALSIVTNFSLADIQRMVNVVGERVQMWRTVWRFPVACTVGWLTRQGLDWLQWSWVRASLMASFVSSCENDVKRCRRTSGEQAGVRPCHRSGSPYRTHHGLQVLLLAATSPSPMGSSSAAVVLWLAEHTRWPLAPPTCLATTEQVLAVVSSANKHVRILRDRYNAARELRTMSDEEAHAEGSFAATLGSLRARGQLDLEPTNWHPTSSMSTMGLGSDLLEEVMDKALSSTNNVPIMAAVAATQTQSQVRYGTSPPHFGDAVTASYDVTRVLESGSLFVQPPAQPWALVSSFQFDVQTAQLRYHDHETYARSVEVLVHVQNAHEPILDAKRWEQYESTSSLLLSNSGISAPWRVTFDHVFFRYPGTEQDVLHDICFDALPGSFLGIVGYSGAGKTTLLLLLARIYAPTQGQIRINGFPIESIPPRALRRRLGNCWQGDRDTCFLEGISVECNVAYGNLAAASTSSVITALSLACMHASVTERPNGLKEPLWYSEWSGGEVARLMLARAVMVPSNDAGMYVFDECTNSLDSLTEAKIFSGCLSSERSVTRVLASHHLSSLRNADKILVLAHGRIVEQGTWTQLLRGAETSLFHTLYRAQSWTS